MTERELLESVDRAKRAFALASWGVARAAILVDEQERSGVPSPGLDPLASALADWRRARSALGRAQARWQRVRVRAQRRPISN